MKKTRAELKVEIEQTEKYLAELMEERRLLIKKYPFDQKHKGTWEEASQQWNDLYPRIHNAQNKLNHLTQLYFGAEEE